MADDEAEMIRAAAEADGLSVAQWLRGTAISASASYGEHASISAAGAADPTTIRASEVDGS